jgi:C1A family cysteine protease
VFSIAADDEGAFLDNRYLNLIHPKQAQFITKSAVFSSDTLEIIRNQSPVKAQKERGTCSMFSTVAYVEGALIKERLADSSIDLSEEWLQFISLNNAPSDGSSAANNFNQVLSYGLSNETTMPYIAEDWIAGDGVLKESRCGHLLDRQKISC